MKKLLAMVLALVMTLSLAVSANAFTDDSKVNDSYAEAVAVLNGMGRTAACAKGVPVP